jgi:hypothetical protein
MQRQKHFIVGNIQDTIHEVTCTLVQEVFVFEMSQNLE